MRVERDSPTTRPKKRALAWVEAIRFEIADKYEPDLTMILSLIGDNLEM